MPYSAFAFTYKYAVITRSRASAAGSSSADAAVGSPPAAGGSPVATAAAAGGALNGPSAMGARMAALTLTANGPVSAADGVGGSSSSHGAGSRSSGSRAPASASASASAAAAAAQPPHDAQQQGSLGVGSIFRTATSTMLEVGEPRVCRCGCIEACALGWLRPWPCVCVGPANAPLLPSCLHPAVPLQLAAGGRRLDGRPSCCGAPRRLCAARQVRRCTDAPGSSPHSSPHSCVLTRTRLLLVHARCPPPALQAVARCWPRPAGVCCTHAAQRRVRAF